MSAPRPGGPGGSAPPPACGSTSSSTAAATSDHPAHPAPPGPAAPGAAPDPHRLPACGPRPACGPGPAAPRPSPAHRPPATPWPPGPRRPGPPHGSRHAPAHGPQHPSAAAAAAHPDAGRSPRTSPPEPVLLPRCRPYHSSMPHSRKLRVIFLQTLTPRPWLYTPVHSVAARPRPAAAAPGPASATGGRAAFRHPGGDRQHREKACGVLEPHQGSPLCACSAPQHPWQPGAGELGRQHQRRPADLREQAPFEAAEHQRRPRPRRRSPGGAEREEPFPTTRRLWWRGCREPRRRAGRVRAHFVHL